MKKVEALIEAFQLDEVIAVLRKHEVDEVVASEVRGNGPVRMHPYRGCQYALESSPKVKLELVVNDELVMATANAICRALGTGRGDAATISVAPVERVVEIEPVEAAVGNPVPRYRPAGALGPPAARSEVRLRG